MKRKRHSPQQVVRKLGEAQAALSAGRELSAVCQMLGIASSTWYRAPGDPDQRRRPGPQPKPIPDEVVRWIVAMAQANPWYGYKKIAVMCRRAGQKVTNRQAYQVMAEFDLLHKRLRRPVELYQALKLYELLPSGPNELWQMDVTYVHIPGYGWRYVVTVIDYYSRYLLASHLTDSYSALEVSHALDLARQEAERIHGPLRQLPFLVTDNGPSFIARYFRQHVKDSYWHVRIRYRTPEQLGLLERFHRTFKEEEIYWRMYDNLEHGRACIAEFRTRYNTVRPHWALIPAEGGDPMTPQDVYVSGCATQIPQWQPWAKDAKAKLDAMAKEAVA